MRRAEIRKHPARTAFSLALGLFAAAAPAAVRAGEEARTFWLTRWNARDEASIVACLDGLRALRANALFVQVYGDGMALYRSSVAPRSPLVSGSFDALATAVREGRRRGIQVHAYMNVCNVYSGGLGAPADPRHIVRAHPEWSVVDSSGAADVALVGTPDTMVFFCPEHDGFREHCVAVAREIVSGYDVDGLHLDYLRFPGGAARCFCAEHRRKFRARFGRDPSHADPDFVEFRKESIARLFSEIHDAAKAIRPAAAVSAALVSSGERYFQDAQRTLEAGKLDIAMPMLYTSDLAEFEARARFFRERSGGRAVFAGVSVASSGGKIREEVEIARRLGLGGQAIFAYSNLDDAGRAALSALWSAAASFPRMPWLDGSPDGAAPVVSGVAAVAIRAEEAFVVWHTDERTLGRVEYGRTASLGLAVEDAKLAFDHAVRLSGLRPSTRYRFRVVAADLAGNAASAEILEFETGSAGPFVAIVDDGDWGFSRLGSWSSGSSAGGFGGDYLFSSVQREETASAEFRPFLPDDGLYAVSVWYVAGSNRSSGAKAFVVSAAGTEVLRIDQTSGGGRWKDLGVFRFRSGGSGYLKLSNEAPSGSVVIADAVRFELVAADPKFVRGDANADGTADLSDAVRILGWLFLGEAPPPCSDAADANDSGAVDLSDAVAILAHLFLGAEPLPPPFPGAGTDPTPDELPPC
ncbi:MAG: golvesin C-terminal-like domain-containing protein [Planctomycetota bacterium]